MVEQIYSKASRKIGQHKKELENALKIKLSISNGIVFIEGEPADELLTMNVIEAINLGFSIEQALDLKNEDFKIETIEIKRLSKRNDLSQIRARIIGKERKALRNIESLTNCDIVVHNNTVGIIGLSEDVDKASRAIKKLIWGSEHSKVYKFLEEEKVKEKLGFQ